MKKKTRRTGTSLLGRASVALLLLAAAAPPVSGQKKGEAPHALIAGTVFRDDGMSLSGADVFLRPPSDAPKEVRKLGKKRYTTDARGEFAIRVPAQPAVYTLAVSAPGFERQEKEVAIQGEDKVDVFIRLQPASK